PDKHGSPARRAGRRTQESATGSETARGRAPEAQARPPRTQVRRRVREHAAPARHRHQQQRDRSAKEHRARPVEPARLPHLAPERNLPLQPHLALSPQTARGELPAAGKSRRLRRPDRETAPGLGRGGAGAPLQAQRPGQARRRRRRCAICCARGGRRRRRAAGEWGERAIEGCAEGGGGGGGEAEWGGEESEGGVGEGEESVGLDQLSVHFGHVFGRM
ncbi:hypothetical protein LTR66_015294, partial [Elasticomyces elasticus]